jgi:hypothetical protein
MYQRALCRNISLPFFSEYVVIYQSTTPLAWRERPTKFAFIGREKFALRYVDYLPTVWRGVCVHVYMTVQSMDLGSAIVGRCGRSSSYVRNQEWSSLSELCFGETLECRFTKYEHILVERNTFKMGTCG